MVLYYASAPIYTLADEGGRRMDGVEREARMRRASEIASEARQHLAGIHEALRESNAALLEPLSRAFLLLREHQRLRSEFYVLTNDDPALVEEMGARGTRLNAIKYPALSGRPNYKGGEDLPEPFGALLVNLIETAGWWQAWVQEKPQ